MAEGAAGIGVQLVRSAPDSRRNTLSTVQGRKERVGTGAGWYVSLVAEQESASSNLCM